MISGKQRQADHCELENILVYIASSMAARSTETPISKQRKLYRFNIPTLKTQNTKIH